MESDLKQIIVSRVRNGMSEYCDIHCGRPGSGSEVKCYKIPWNYTVNMSELNFLVRESFIDDVNMVDIVCIYWPEENILHVSIVMR